jgi:hypothetical protein
MFGQDDTAQFCRPNCQRAYGRLYNMEAYLRFMLRWELVGAFAENWKTHLADVMDEAEKRLEQERALRIIDADELNIMSYMMLSDLKDVMFRDTVWPLFKQQWPPMDMLQTDFKLLIAVRNKNAHFRPVTPRDLRAIERVQTIISEMTEHYRRERANAFPKAPDKLPDPFKGPVMKWLGSMESEEAPWATLTVTKLQNYFRIDANLKRGALPADAVQRIVTDGKADCLFAGLDAASGRLSLYLPKSIGAAQAGRLIDTAMMLAPIEAELVPLAREEAPRLDYVFEADMLLPAPFRLEGKA